MRPFFMAPPATTPLSQNIILTKTFANMAFVAFMLLSAANPYTVNQKREY